MTKEEKISYCESMPSCGECTIYCRIEQNEDYEEEICTCEFDKDDEE